MEAKNSPHKQKQKRISSTHAESTHRGRETFRYMEEEALADQEEAEVIGSLTTAPGSLEARDFKWDHKDVSWEGEFIKVEKDDEPFFREHSPNTESVNRQIPEAGGKITQLEIELERLAQALQGSTLENAQLKHELSLTRKKFDERERSHIELEREHKRLQEKLQEAEENFAGQLAMLQEALQEEEAKNRQLMDIKEAFDSLNLESESSKKNTERLERELQSSVATKFKGVNEKTSKLELLLKAEKEKVQELEEQISKSEDLYQEAKVEAKANYDMVSHLKSEVEKLHLSTSSLEEALELANEKETELTELLNASTEEKSKSEKEVSSLITKLHETEDESEQLKNEATVAQRKLLSLESDLKATGHREREVMEKLKLAEDQLKQEREAIQKVSTRNSELEASHVSLVRDSERKIDEAMKNFTEKESEAKTMFHRLQFLDDQVQVYEEQVADAAHKLATLAEDLDLSSKKVASLERSNKDLKEMLSEAGKKTGELLEQNMMLASTNEQLQNKMSELEELLQSANYEKESVAQQVASHLNTIRDLTDKLTKSEELQSATETRALQAETLLKETTQILADKELEEKVLNERFIEVQYRVRTQEKQAREASEIAKMESDQTKQILQGKENLIGDLQQKLGQLESHNNVLTEANMTLGEELAGWESKLSVTLAEKEDVLEQLNTSKKSHEDLMQRLTSEKRILELEIAAVKEESHLLHEALGEREKEHKGATGVLEDQLSTLMRKFQETEKLLDDSKGKIADLESALTQASSQNCELRGELKRVSEQRTEHEERANTTHQRSLELEDLLQSSHSRFDGAEKKASELESLLEAERRKIEELERQMNANSMKYREAEVESKARIRELEEQMSTLERKYQDTEVELKAQSDMVSELKSEAEKLHLSTSHLEEKLQAAKEKEKTVTEIMDAYAEGKRKSEEEVNTLIGKLEEAEGMLERLRGERESIRNDLKASTLRETDIMENLRSAQDQLQRQGQVIQEATARNIELESLHESRARDSRLKLHDATERIKEKEMEVKSLSQKLKLLEEQLHVYEEQASEAADKVAASLGELHLSSKKIASLEFSNEELRKMVSEAEVKARESLSAYNILVDTKAQLQNKVDEVQALLDSADTEKKLLAQQAASQMNTIRELTDQHTRSRELLSANEGRTLQAETLLQETNAILAEALRKNTELEERFKSLQALHEESTAAVASASKRNIELDEIIQAANAAAEEVKLLRQGLESKLKETEDRNVKLEQQLTLVETNRIEAERELKQSFEKLSELGAKNKEMETESEKLNGQFEEYKAKLTEAESAWSQARLYSSQLEEELKKAVERTAEHEGRANATHQRSRELEDLLQNSHSKVEGSEKRIGELEALLEEEKQRVQELEEQISSLATNYEEAQAESKAQLDTIHDLRSEIEKLQLSIYCSEEAIQKADDNERSLQKLLKDSQEERKKAEEDSELKLHEAMEMFMARDSAANSLTHKLKLLENKLQVYEEQATEANHTVAVLEEELDLSSKKISSMERTNEGLRKMISEAADKATESLKHHTHLVGTNQQLQNEVNELQELLQSANYEKESVAQQVASHLNTIRDLTDKLTKSEELQSATETRALQAETLLKETTQILADKELEEKVLNERFIEVQYRVRTQEKQAREASEIAKMESDQTKQMLQGKEKLIGDLQQKLGQLESHNNVLTEANMTLGEELAGWESKLSVTLAEKEDVLEQLNTSKKSHEDLMQRLTSEKRILELEIAAVKEESHLLHEALGEREKEHKGATGVLEDQLSTLMRKFQETEKLLDDSKGKIADLESALTQASSQNCELRGELKRVSEQRTEHEERANTTHQRSLELEDLLQSSHSRFDGAEKKASELESLLEAERRKIEELERQMNANSMKYREAEVESKARIRELEEQMSTLERKYQDTEVELKAQSDMVSELKSEAEKLHLSTSHLEEKLQAAKEKEKTVTEIMDAYAEGKRKSEEEVNTLIGKLEEAEGMLERLRGERESIRNDLKASTLRETDIMENLRSAQDQLQRQGQVIQEATARNIELESLHESRARDSRLKLHDATERIKEKEMEVKSLSQKLKLLEEQLHVYEEQASEAADKVAASLGELHLSSKKIASLEFSNEELRKMVSEAEVKARESLSAYNILVDTKAQLQNKVDEVQALLDSADTEKKLLAQQAASQMNTIRELTDQHTRSRELLSANEGRTLQAETLLQETNAILAEALRKNTELEERFKSLQALHEESTAAVASASKRNIELDEIIQAANAAAEEVKLLRQGLESKLKETEDRNVKLEQQLTLVETNRIEAERELKQSFEKLSELGAKNKEMETESEKLNGQFEEYKAKLTETESAWSQARLYSSQLEEELKKAVERTAEHEGRANATHQRSRELEDLLQNSHSKVEGSEKGIGELEALLEKEKHRVQELEEQISSLEKQYKEAKADSKAHLGVVSQLRLEVEKLELSNLCFEEAMEKASDKERSLTKLLEENQEERNKAEEDSEMRLKEAIEKFTAKDSEVKSITHQQKLLENRMKDYEEQAVEAAHKMALLVENLDLSSKRRASLESSNKELRKMISDAEERARESLEHNSLLVDRNQLLQDKVNELQELLDSVNCKNEVVARQVASRLNNISELTDQHTRSHELQSATDTQGLQLEMQLEETTQKLAEKELDVEEMKERFTVFKDQVNTLENEVHEASKIVSSKTVELEWTEQKLREQEEMTEKLEQKLGKLESSIDVLTKENIKLNEDLAESEYRLDYVQTYISGTLSEKEAALEQINTSKKVLEDWTEKLNSEKQVLESEISSVKVANSLLHEAQREREKEHCDVISHLEERLTKYKLSEEAIKAEVQNLKVKSAQKLEFRANLMELEEQFVTTEAKLQKEVTTVQAPSALRQEDMMTSNLEQHVEKVQDRDALKEKVLQLEQKLQLAHSSIAQLTEENSTKSSKSEGVIKHLSEQLKQKSQQVMLLAKETKELREKLQVASRSSSAKGGDAMEAKSRDYSTSVTSVTKRKSMRRAQISVPAQTFCSSKKRALPVAEVYYALDFKFVLRVALVSIVVGIILGKRY